MSLPFLEQCFKSWCPLVALTPGFVQLNASAKQTSIAFERDSYYSLQGNMLVKLQSAFISSPHL